MKLLTFRQNGADYVGALSNDGATISVLDRFHCMQELIESGVSPAELQSLAKSGARLDYAAVEKRSPIPHPRQDVICLGVNYMDHAKESAAHSGKAFDGERKHAVYFSKRCYEALPDGGVIPPHWDIDDTLDYEVELAVIIGKDARKVSEADALDYVFGYSILNDVSARALQTRHQQFYFGKGLDGCTPFGPYIVTRDEIASPAGLDLKSYVNGELRQSSNTKNLIFSVPCVISELSQGIELKAGTIIATGTPSGVGFGFNPPRYLKPGDAVTCEIEQIGILRNRVG